MRTFHALPLLMSLACAPNLAGTDGEHTPDDPETTTPERPDAPSEPDDEDPRVDMEPGARDLTATISLASEGAQSPRMLEVFVHYDDALRFEGSEAAPSLSGSGKRLVVQERGANTLRLIAFSADNLNPIASGDLASLRFSRSGQGKASVEVLLARSQFAPGGARPTGRTLSLRAVETAHE